MKAVLMSIQPRWCELIASGKKTVEVRKTKPKLETPFKVYIYCTADRRKHIADTFVPQTPLFVKNGVAKSNIGREDGLPWKLGNGKVIGEFVCDEIYDITPHFDTPTFPNQYICGWEYGKEFDCLSFEELTAYLSGKKGYAWHISDLVIYDKPRELHSFFKPRTVEEIEADVAVAILTCGIHESPFAIKKPPQSWCYVEESKRWITN
jgi:predicted transcriptional regulator